jgi:signal-transduction protein with cAMP-binding, CBS, and nucleotidyltransferase domain
MIPLFKPKIFMNNDIIITEGDSNIEVYFIPNTGLCQVKIGGVFVSQMTEGDYFGEIAVFLRSRRRTATIVCLKDSDFLLLEGNHFEKLLKDFPEDHGLIKKMAINRLLDSMKLYPSSLFAKLVPSNNIKDYMFRKCIYLENEEEDALMNEKKSKNQTMFNHKIEAICENMREVKKNLEVVTKFFV